MKFIKCTDSSEQEVYIYADAITKFIVKGNGKTDIICSMGNTYSINIETKRLLKEIYSDFEVIREDEYDSSESLENRIG